MSSKPHQRAVCHPHQLEATDHANLANNGQSPTPSMPSSHFFTPWVNARITAFLLSEEPQQSMLCQIFVAKLECPARLYLWYLLPWIRRNVAMHWKIAKLACIGFWWQVSELHTIASLHSLNLSPSVHCIHSFIPHLLKLQEMCLYFKIIFSKAKQF